MIRIVRLLLVTLTAASFCAAAVPAGAAPPLDSPAGVVVQQLDAALNQRGIPGPHDIDLDSPTIVLPHGMTSDSLRLADLTEDAPTGRFVALFGGSDDKQRLRVTGRVFQLIDIIVPARVIEPGEIIDERDLERATVRRDPAAQDPLADAASLVGKTPRHPLRAREPVHAADLQAPIVVHRGELVTMVLETPLMTLTAQGEAMEDAAHGAAIRVSNGKSNRVVEAVVTGPGTVAVEPPAGQ
jgi:flagella basal body P-ring formation protein FlgA